MIGYLLVFALVLFFLEVFLPGGILAVGGVLLILAASILGFVQYGANVGFAILIGGSLVSILFFYFEIKFLTDSKVGQHWFGHHLVSDGKIGQGDLSGLIGESGVTVTRMAPGGKIRVGETTYDALSIDGYLPAGASVVVNSADTFTIRVTSRSS